MAARWPPRSPSSKGPTRVAAFLSGVVRKGWTDDLSVRFQIINGLPGLLVIGPRGLVQTNAFEIEDGIVKAIYVVRSPDKLRHLTPASAAFHIIAGLLG